MIYIALILVLVIAVIALFMPWRQDSTSLDPLSVYRDQIDELTRDRAEGRIDPAEADAAMLEIQRRMLKAGEGKAVAGTALGGRTRRITAVVVVLGAAGIYALFGAPDVPAQPGQRVQMLDQLLTEGGPTFGEAIAAIEDRLRADPSDAQGWELLGRTTMGVGAYQKAVNAYRRRAALGDPQGQFKVMELEAFLAMGGGRVSSAALLVAQALERDHPDHPAGPFYRGMAALQAGDRMQAYTIWKALADNSEDGAPWLVRLLPQLETLADQLGIDDTESQTDGRTGTSS